MRHIIYKLTTWQTTHLVLCHAMQSTIYVGLTNKLLILCNGFITHFTTACSKQTLQEHSTEEQESYNVLAFPLAMIS